MAAQILRFRISDATIMGPSPTLTPGDIIWVLLTGICPGAPFRPQCHPSTSDPSLHDRLSADARRLVEEKYDWQLIGEQFVGFVRMYSF